MSCLYTETGQSRETALGMQRRIRCIHCGKTAWISGSLASVRGNCRTIRGPGTELKAILASLGFAVGSCASGCEARAQQMDRWGVDGCREHRAEIIGWLRAGAAKAGWSAAATAGAKAVLEAAKGGWWPSILDPFGSIVDEAIRRAEQPPA